MIALVSGCWHLQFLVCAYIFSIIHFTGKWEVNCTLKEFLILMSYLYTMEKVLTEMPAGLTGFEFYSLYTLLLWVELQGIGHVSL